ncbi:MAG: sulfur carrier protein ThiS adenylyltransferase ThiF [Chitinispirillaceae bacterium]|nr:sulfur carrier protein ThiS adenylyltransferase ThiF [Chitinispirillaceae bacterium]
MAEGFSFSEVTASYFNKEQRESLQRITVGIAGAGGIGSNCAIMLVRSGFSGLVIADFDRVTASNLNRQAYSIDHIGRVKVECLREVCAAINPAAAIAAYPVRIDPATIHDIFDGCDAVIEAFDDPAGKALLFGEYLHSGKLLVGVSGIAGIGESDRIVVRKIGERCYIVGDAVSAVSETLRPHAPRVMVAAAKMADIVLSWALSRPVFSG